jgi:hypothetical protein
MRSMVERDFPLRRRATGGAGRFNYPLIPA